MERKEIVKRLYEFADYLDNMEGCKDKAILSSFFVGYNEAVNRFISEAYKNYSLDLDK